MVLAWSAIALATAAFASGSSARPSARSALQLVLDRPGDAQGGPRRSERANDLAFTQSMYAALETLEGPEHLQISISDNEFVVVPTPPTYPAVRSPRATTW